MADSSNLLLQLLITAKDDASAALGKIGDKITSVAKTAAAFVGLGVSMQDSVQSAANFEEQLGKVAVKGGYTAEQMAELQAGVEQIAAQFGVTGQEAAQGMEVLAAAGLSAKDAIATLPQVLALAQMEGLSLDDAATKLSDTLSIMGLGFDQAGRMADVLAKGANITTSSAASLSEALSKVGGQAKAAGLDLEQTVAALDLLHKNGIKGSEAGTSLAAILTQLLNPASAASAQLSLLGISTRDLGGVLDGLQAAGAKAGPAILAFGETAGPGLRALISEGRQGLDDFTGQLRNLDGDALKAAQALSVTFNSALKALGAAWDTVARQLAAPLLAPLTAGLRAVSAALGDTAGLLGGAFLAAAALVGKSIAQLAAALPGWVASLRASAAALSVAELATVGFSRALALLTGPVGLILTAVAGFLAFRKGAEASKGPLDALQGSVEQQAEALKKLGNAQLDVAKTTLQKAIAEQTAEVAKLGQAAQETAGKVGQQVIVWDDWRQGAHRVTVGQEQLAEANAKVEEATQKLNTLTQQYNTITAEQAQRAAQVTATQTPHAQSVRDLSAAYSQALNEVDSYQEVLRNAAPGSEAAKNAALALADAERRAAAAKEAYLNVLLPARAAQQQYNQTVAEAAATLAPYQALVTKLRGELEQQQKAHQDTTVTAEKLKQAQALLAQQTDAYWTRLQQLQPAEAARPDALQKISGAYLQQYREVARLTLAQDGSKASADALQAANAQLAQREIEYANALGQVIQAITQRHQSRQADLTAQDQQLEVAERLLQAQKAEAERTLELAQAQGNEWEARQQLVQIAQIEANLALRNAERKTIELQAATATVEILQEEFIARQRAGEAINATDMARLKAAAHAMELAAIEADAAGKVAEAESRKAAAAQLAGLANQEAAKQSAQATQGFSEQTQAAKENAQALADGEKATAAYALLQKQLTEYLNGARSRMDELSASARLYFEAILEATLAAENIQGAQQGSLRATQAWTAATREGSDELAKFAQEIASAGAQIGAARQDLLFAADEMRVWISAISLSEATVKKAFYEQATAAETLKLRIQDLSESGRLTIAELTRAEREAQDGFKLLDNEDLTNLRAEIDKAKQKLEEMQQATEDARTRLSELNAELLEAQGQDQKAELLRQQLDYETRLAEIEKQRHEAELLGNRDLVAILTQQEQVLRQINEAKVASIQADDKAEQAGDKVANSWSRAESAIRSTSAALGEVHNLGQSVAEIDLSLLNKGLETATRHAQTLRGLL